MKVCNGKVKTKFNTWFDSVWSNHLGKAQHTLGMEQTLENYDFGFVLAYTGYTGLKDANVKILRKNTDNVIKSNKCNQCDYASSQAGDLRTHLKTHSGEKSNKFNQCNENLKMKEVKSS